GLSAACPRSACRTRALAEPVAHATTPKGSFARLRPVLAFEFRPALARVLAITPRSRGMSNVSTVAKRIIGNMEKVIVGKRQELAQALVALLCDGHVLLEDVPGVAKTMMARALAISTGCGFKRVQCTPDLLPTDVTGASIFNQKAGEFEFRAGPVFSHV